MAESKIDLEDEIPVHVEQTVGAQQNHDDVFGELSDDGPNFRNVNIPCHQLTLWSTNLAPGRLRGNHRSYDEISDRSRSSRDPICFRYPWHGTRYHLSFGDGRHHNMVWVYHWKFQIESPGGLQYR